MPNIFAQYFQWHYYEMPQNLLRAWGNFLEFGLNYFSTLQLVRTIFSPWRRYMYEYPRHFDPGQWFNAFSFNLMSRGIGAMVRVMFIFIGITAELFILVFGAVVFALWMVTPVIVLGGLSLGIILLF